MKYLMIFLLCFTGINAYSKVLKTDGRNENKIGTGDSLNFKVSPLSLIFVQLEKINSIS